MAQQFFGTPDQQKVTRSAADLWTLLKDDRRFSSHGRAVGTNGYVTYDLELQVALTRQQGAGPCDCLPENMVQEREAELAALGFLTDTYVHWESGPESVALCKAYLADHALPDDIDLLAVDRDTPLAQLGEIARLLGTVDMMLPMESFVRGQAYSSIYLAAIDRDGRPVAHASSTAAFHPEASNGDEAHWGMLATAHHRRGEGLAVYLGALALTRMHHVHGFAHFGTGIRKGNRPSENLSAKLGFASRGRAVVVAIDPQAIGSATMTK